MEYIEALNIYNTRQGDNPSLFLAGGITNCPDWQKEMVYLLKDEDVILLNPRRKNFPMGDLTESDKQIKWEYNHLEKADAISFWFPKETLCPITLYELGARLRTHKNVFIGVHPEFARKIDVEVQTELVRPDIKVVYSLENLANNVKKWLTDV
jgi:hypothetical protein